jgi:hypothetical protein
MSRVNAKALDAGDHGASAALRVPFTLLGASAAAIIGACEAAVSAFTLAIAEHSPSEVKQACSSDARDIGALIPEQACPPRCVCEIELEAAEGDELRVLVRVRNVSQSARTFSFESTELVGWGGTLGAMSISPTQLALDPQMSDVIEATLTVRSGAEKGKYQGEIVVRGAYEQSVRAVAKIVKKKWAHRQPTAACEVEQGAPPVRIRAHHWYDHFQCVQPCGDGDAQHA